MLPKEVLNREEHYLYAIATGDTTQLPKAIGRQEKYLEYIALNGTSGGGSTISSGLVETSVVDSVLNLTTDMYQHTTLIDNTQVILPTVSDFAEIHLFFDTTEALTITLPSIKWQSQPNIAANCSYEFIFTYVNGTWLGGCICYN